MSAFSFNGWPQPQAKPGIDVCGLPLNDENDSHVELLVWPKMISGRGLLSWHAITLMCSCKQGPIAVENGADLCRRTVCYIPQNPWNGDERVPVHGRHFSGESQCCNVNVEQESRPQRRLRH